MAGREDLKDKEMPPSREEMEDREDYIQTVNLVMKGVTVASYFVPAAIESTISGTTMNIFNKNFTSNFSKAATAGIDDLANQIASRGKKYWAFAPLNELSSLTYPNVTNWAANIK